MSARRVTGVVVALLGLNLFVATCWYGDSLRSKFDVGQTLLLTNGVIVSIAAMALGAWLAVTS